MPLTDVKIRNAKPGDRTFKISDGGGLQLWISPAGGKVWHLAYRHDGKQKKLAIGPYPAFSLHDARQRREDAKRLLAEGRDPNAVKAAERAQALVVAGNTFDMVAAELLAKKKREGKAGNTIGKREWLYSLAHDDFGSRPVAEITAPEILAVLQRLEGKGHLETARRLRSCVGEVFRFAIATGRASADPTQALKGAVATPTVKHRAAITDSVAFGGLMRAVEGFQGQPATKAALQLMAYLFPRPGELRAASWAEFDIDKALWTIPAVRTKMRKEHRVPLPRQALATLEGLKHYTGHAALVFPGLQSPKRPLSENTMNIALRRLGYGQDEMTSHGFRASASSMLNESGKWHPDVIERALGHAERDDVRAAYNRAQLWPERVAMSQWWADYVDALRDGAQIIPMKRA